MTTSVEQHRSEGPAAVRCAVVTVSDTRTLATDTGGQTVVDRLIAAGHVVVERHILPDEPERMR
ncbi:MAG: molybdenum cofactor biosynthesis protein, partial [Planctomycetota bacterium]|nr:molybdenum cofactor biosynthesis protein [Planctomycetota bacterium]